MSVRYGWLGAVDTSITIALPGTLLGDDPVTEEMALVISGDEVTVIEGSRARIVKLLRSALLGIDKHLPLPEPEPAPITYTVVGAWIDDEPVSVAVIEGDHPVSGGDGNFEQGVWATSVTATTPDEAERLAVAGMGETLNASESEEG